MSLCPCMNRRRLLSFLAFAPLAVPAAIAAAPLMVPLSDELHEGRIVSIANLMKASRQILDDAPTLQSYIDGRINYRVVPA
jgi:hypothetical protein